MEASPVTDQSRLFKMIDAFEKGFGSSPESGDVIGGIKEIARAMREDIGTWQKGHARPGHETGYQEALDDVIVYLDGIA